MSNKTRKHIWPISLVMSIAIVGALAAFLVLAANPRDTQAHRGGADHDAACAAMTSDARDLHNTLAGATGGTPCPDPSTPTSGTPPTSGTTNQGEADPPSAPTSVVAVVGDGKLTITWETPRTDGDSPITGYMVEYKEAGEPDDDYTSTRMLPASDREYVITGLTNEERYTVRVVAMNRVGSTKSSVVTKEPLAVPSMPRSLAVASHGGQRISVSWDAPSSEGDSPINKYKWELADDDSAGDPYGTFGSKRAREADPPTFDPDDGGAITADAQTGCHTVTVEAYNDDNNNVPGDVAMVTCPSVPTNFSKQVVDNVVILRWGPPAKLGSPDAAVTEYVVNRTGYERSRTATDTAMKGAMIPGEKRQWTVGSSMTTLWDTGLSHQTIYEYTIFAVTNRYEMGDSMMYYMVSSPLTAFTSTDGGLILAPPSGPNAPTGLALVSQCADRITLTWRAPTQVGGGVDPRLNRDWSHGKIVVGDDAAIDLYEVQYRESGRGSWMDLAPNGRRADVSTGLEYDKTYDFRVRATNNIGLSGPWASQMIELEDPGRPLIPRSLNVDPIAANTVELEWLAPLDIADSPLWRTQTDFDHPGDASRNLRYQIERQVGATGSWTVIEKPYHQYGETLDDHRTQGYTDETAPAGNVNYRVAALVNDCNKSDYSQKDEISVMAAPLTLGTPASVTATSSAAGAITVSYTAGVNATGHLIILAQGSTLVDFDVSIDGSDASFSNVAAGNYTAIVVSFRRMGGTLEFKHSRDTVTVN